MFINEIVSDKKYDIAIVGSGPAGMSLAIRLAEKSNAKILLLETGGLKAAFQTHQLSMVEATGDLPSKYYPVHSQRLFGGTSNYWAGYCATLEKRSFLNDEWPMVYEDIEPFYKDAADILELPKEAYQTPTRKLADDIHNIVYKPYYMSRPVRFGDKYLSYFKEHSNIDVLLNSTCTDILQSGKSITGLMVQNSNGRSAASVKVEAKYYALACGGIGNARLMQLGGVAKKSPVGNYFMEHPHVYGAGVVELDKKIIDSILDKDPADHALQLSDEYCVANGLLSCTVDFSVDYVRSRIILGEKKDVYVSNVITRSEMLPHKSNRVYLGSKLDGLKQAGARLHFKFNYQNLAKKTWNAFAKELLVSGIGRAAKPPAAYKEIVGGGHYLGTTRMGSDAKNSVVDGDCKVHNVDNLYVAGSSIFSAAGAANPTFSIVAFSLRLADHLASKV